MRHISFAITISINYVVFTAFDITDASIDQQMTARDRVKASCGCYHLWLKTKSMCHIIRVNVLSPKVEYHH
eukprot:2621356-Amphidinium_carterae.1